MTESSQNPPGAQAPEPPSVRRPLPDSTALQGAFATFGVALPVPAGSPAEALADVPAHLVVPALEPSVPECFGCGDREGPWYPDPAGRRYPSGAQIVFCGTCVPDPAPSAPVTPSGRAAAALIAARMGQEGGSTAAELAAVEEHASILFDAAQVEAVRTAEREQARTEYAAELAELRRQLAVMAGAHRQVVAVLRLCEGRRGDDLLLVSAVAVAAESGITALDEFPMRLAWTRRAQIPDAHTARRQVVVECTSSYGGRADLIVEGDDRMALGSLLDAEAYDVHAKCPTYACGTDQDLDAVARGLRGWARLEVAGIEGGPRWYCSPGCISAAMARAGDTLALADQAAAVDPGQPDEPADVAAGLDARYGPGASDEYVLQLGEAAGAAFEDERGNGDGGW